MSPAIISFSKKALLVFWFAAIVSAAFFSNTEYGFYLAIAGALIFAVHIVETWIFHDTIAKYSNNVIKDKIRVLAFGFLVPVELKLKYNENNNQNT